ncbi:MAG: hypothetical protein AB7T22_07570 [Calditrichaceae bacterium]
MSGFLQGKTSKENLPIKRFGYMISAIFLILANIGLYKNWSATPWLFLLTMYFLTGSLWVTALIKPFYSLLGKYFIKDDKSTSEEKDDSFFSEN